MKKILVITITLLCLSLQLYSGEKKLDYEVPYSCTGILTEADFSEKAAALPQKPIEPEAFYSVGEWYNNEELESAPRYISVTNENTGLTLKKNLLDVLDKNYQVTSLSGAFFPSSDYVDFLATTCFYVEEHYSDIYLYLIRFDFQKKESYLITKECISSPLYNLICGTTFNESAKTFYDMLLNDSYSITEHNSQIPVEYCGSRRSFPLTTKGKIVTHNASSEENYFPNFLYLEDIKYQAKTELKEGSVTYFASNLAADSNAPWVSELKDITQEEITITSPDTIYCLIFGNGFKHKDKTALFSKNKRPKEISIQYENNHGLEHHVILEDSEKLQIIPLLFINSKIIKIRILSTYQGTMYNDTCINCIKCGKVMTFDEFRRLEK